MDMLSNIGLVCLGGLVLYLGAEWLVKGAAGLARTLGLREIIIGLTVVAYGTSAPELAVSISANLGGSSPLVFGNVIGSCIANLGLILGVTILIAPPSVDPTLIRRDLPVLLASVIVLPIMLYAGGVSRLESLILFAMATVYTIVTFSSAKSENAPSAEELESAAEAAGAPAGEGVARLIVIGVVGLALLIGGGELFVRGAKGVALDLGMSDRMVGLTIVAFGTSLPELAASLVAALRGHSALAIGNVVGSNIFNVFLVLGASGTIRPLPATFSDMLTDLGFMLGMTIFGVAIMHKERRLSRVEGVLLVSAYVAFVVVAVTGL